MKNKITYPIFLLSFAMAGFLLLSANCFAQPDPNTQAKGKKTITIHVTKEVNGDITVIDTTVVTDGDFDADAFLEQKGVTNGMPGSDRHIEKNIVIRHPGSHQPGNTDADGHVSDTVIIDDNRVVIFTDTLEFDMPGAFPGDPSGAFHPDFSMPDMFSHMEGPQMEAMLEAMVNSLGLGNVMPFGEMKKVVVKNKHHGKKVIITFEERGKASCDRHSRRNNDDRVVVYHRNGNPGAQHHEERVIVKVNRDDKETDAGDTDKPTSGKQQKKVIIIREERTK